MGVQNNRLIETVLLLTVSLRRFFCQVPITYVSVKKEEQAVSFTLLSGGGLDCDIDWSHNFCL